MPHLNKQQQLHLAKLIADMELSTIISALRYAVQMTTTAAPHLDEHDIDSPGLLVAQLMDIRDAFQKCQTK